MRNDATKSIKTARLTLRPYKADDYKHAFKNYLTDEKTTKFLTWEPYRNTLQAFAFCVKMRKTPYVWAIVLDETNEIIGGICSQKQQGIYASGDAPDKVVYDIGYSIGSKWWGKGIMAEVAKAIIDYLLLERGVDIVTAMHDINNPNSGKVMKKAGMQYEKNIWRPNCKDKTSLTEYCLYLIKKQQNENV